MWLSQSEDELAEVTIIRDEHTILTYGNYQDLSILEVRAIVCADSCDVVRLALQVWDEASV
jgi:hypothetical protein